MPTITILRIDNGWVVATPAPPFGSGVVKYVTTAEALAELIRAEATQYPAATSVFAG